MIRAFSLIRHSTVLWPQAEGAAPLLASTCERANAQSIDDTVAAVKAFGAEIGAGNGGQPDHRRCVCCGALPGEERRGVGISTTVQAQYDNHWPMRCSANIGKETPNGMGVEIDVNGRKVVAYEPR
jgi:hypothetical protein